MDLYPLGASRVLPRVVPGCLGERPRLCAVARPSLRGLVPGRAPPTRRVTCREGEWPSRHEASGLRVACRRVLSWHRRPLWWRRLQRISGQVPGSIAHDEVTYRHNEDGLALFIPQAERYSTADWFRNLLNWPQSGILKRIWHPILCITIWSAVVCFVDASFPWNLRVSNRAHILVSSALSLLLVFRTNAAYNRFQDGRRIWESVTSISRDIARRFALYSEPLGRAKARRLAGMLAVFPVLLQEHVQGKQRRTKYLWKTLRGLEVDVGGPAFMGLQSAMNRPLHVLNLISKEVNAVPMQPERGYESRDRLTLLNQIGRLAETVAACERLVQTPVPLNYFRHTSRFLSTFMLTLPFALLEELGCMTVFVTAFTAWVFFGILEIGLMIEEPFSRALRLEVICSTIIADIMQTMHTIAPTTGEQRSGVVFVPLAGSTSSATRSSYARLPLANKLELLPLDKDHIPAMPEAGPSAQMHV